MPIIKQQQSTPLLKEAIVLDLGDLSRQAARLRSAAEAKAAQILHAAEQEAQKLIQESASKGFEQGQANGFEQGLEEGREQGRTEALQQYAAQLEQIAQSWSDVAGQWDAQRQLIEREARQAILELALGLAERLVHRVVEVDPTVVVDQVATALGHVMKPLDPTVRINPDDRPVLEEAMPQLLAEFKQFQHVQLVDDETIGRGGCVITYGQGAIDAQLDVQLQRIIELMVPDDSQAGEAADTPLDDAMDQATILTDDETIEDDPNPDTNP